MAEVISVLSRKGGVGKTVTAMFAAAYLAQQGKDVAVLDTDPEGSAGAWARAAGNLPFQVYPEGKQAQAMKHAIEAGRLAYRAGRMPRRMGADPSSPLSGLIR